MKWEKEEQERDSARSEWCALCSFVTTFVKLLGKDIRYTRCNGKFIKMQ